MSSSVILGNAVFFLGAIILMSLGFFRTKRNFLLAQCTQEGLMGLSMLILGGYAGFFVDIVSIIRNLVSLRWSFTVVWKMLFIVILIGIYAAAGSEGFMGWMPIIATCLFTWFLDTDNIVLLKALIVVTQLMWFVYDMSVSNYVGMIVDVTSAITNGAGIIWNRKN